jgi:prefoldin subunit 5
VSFLEQLIRHQKGMNRQLEDLERDKHKLENSGEDLDLIKYRENILFGQIIQLKSDLTRIEQLISEYKSYVNSIKNIFTDLSEVE